MTRTGRCGRTLATGALLLAVLAGCGDGDDTSSQSEPAVCGDVDDLRSSVQALQAVSLNSGVLDTFRTDVDRIKADLATLKADAKSQFDTEIARLSAARDAVSADLAAATASPSGAALSTLAASVRDLGDAARALQTAVADTC